MKAQQVRTRIAILSATLLIGAASTSAQTLDGGWSSEGYGLYFDVSGPTLKAYEVTAISCLPSFTANAPVTDRMGT